MPTVAVVGLGYVGMPLVLRLTHSELNVLGIDTNESTVRTADKMFSGTGLFSGTTDFGALTDAKDLIAVIVCVPTPLTQDQRPDLSHVIQAMSDIALNLDHHSKQPPLIVLESTTYPGTTREVVLPLLSTRGQLGRDFYLAYSPERTDPGNKRFTLGNTPKLVGAADPASLGAAVNLYKTICERVVPVSCFEVAEAAKLYENAYRAVNIALANDFKLICERLNLDVFEVIDAAATKPFGFQAFYPGPGLGGHCIPIDPFYLSWAAKRAGAKAELIELAGKINTWMPHHIFEQVQAALNDLGKPVRDSKVLMLGVAYKKDSGDIRESPAMKIAELIKWHGGACIGHDPHVEKYRFDLTNAILQESDLTLIVTDHSCYDWNAIVINSQMVIDTRNATKHVTHSRQKIRKA